MDATTAHLVDFALQSEFSGLSTQSVHECKRRLIDTFACAVGAYHEPISRMARAVAQRNTGSPPASVWGCAWRTTAESAAFANGVMLRLDDTNDGYRVKSGGHPSDVISGIFAIGEAVHADGASVINAVSLAYDVYCSFCEAVDINSKGWDQPVYGILACVLGVGKLLRLSREQMANAVALALAPNMALFQTRRGDLSAWKGCAGANASRNAVFAALLAQDGFTGPTAVFEGKSGLWDVIGRFDWQIEIGPNAPHRVTQTLLKCFPVCGHGQSPASAAIEIRPRVRIRDVTDIQVETYRQAKEEMGNDPSRWAPKTRETADHSIPYVVAVGLLDGEITPVSFTHERLVDPVIATLMEKVKVVESPELSARFPESWSCRLSIRMAGGERVVAEVINPKGHISNPINDSELEAKFRGMWRDYGNDRECKVALEGLWSFDSVKDIGEVLKLFVTRP